MWPQNKIHGGEPQIETLLRVYLRAHTCTHVHGLQGGWAKDVIVLGAGFFLVGDLHIISWSGSLCGEMWGAWWAAE